MASFGIMFCTVEHYLLNPEFSGCTEWVETVVRSVFLGVTFIILQLRQLDQLNGAIVSNGHFSHNCNEISVGCFIFNKLQFWF